MNSNARPPLSASLRLRQWEKVLGSFRFAHVFGQALAMVVAGIINLNGDRRRDLQFAGVFQSMALAVRLRSGQRR
jgi:hypothetical protein